MQQKKLAPPGFATRGMINWRWPILSVWGGFDEKAAGTGGDAFAGNGGGDAVRLPHSYPSLGPHARYPQPPRPDSGVEVAHPHLGAARRVLQRAAHPLQNFHAT